MGEEDRIQQECLLWFWNTYPALRKMLFSVPNGGKRDGITAKIMKATGLTPGVSDVILLYGTAYLLECKTEKGRQSKTQEDWQMRTEFFGLTYKIFRSREEFAGIIGGIVDVKYLKLKNETIQEYSNRIGLKIVIKDGVYVTPQTNLKEK